jgi:hypothetical protein
LFLFVGFCQGGSIVSCFLLFLPPSTGILTFPPVHVSHVHTCSPSLFFSDVDRAIGKLTDVRFFRDLRAVSDLTQHSKPGAFAHATATAMHKGKGSTTVCATTACTTTACTTTARIVTTSAACTTTATTTGAICTLFSLSILLLLLV